MFLDFLRFSLIFLYKCSLIFLDFQTIVIVDGDIIKFHDNLSHSDIQEQFRDRGSPF